jgi:hypothetical protein
MLLLATSISVAPAVDAKTLSPEVNVCISARSEVSPSDNRDVMSLNAFS